MSLQNVGGRDGAVQGHHLNPHNVYANNTAYGYRDRDNSFNQAKQHQPIAGPIFGAGGLNGHNGSGGAYNDLFNTQEGSNNTG